MASGWLWFFGLLWAYLILVFWLVRSGRMQKWNISLLLGFIMMIRTQRGKGAIDAIARPKRFWNLFGDLGILAAWGSMLGFTFLMLLTVGPSLDPARGIRAASASEILAIPGVNPYIPLWYGLIGLIVTLVVHEGGHGILARANNLKVKSVGLLFAIVPVGAFVEPDEDEIKEASRRKRLRVFCAGPAVNFAVAFIALGGLIALMGAVSPVAGVGITGVVKDAPADLGGVEPADIIISVNGTATPDWDTFVAAMDSHHPGDVVSLTRSDGATHNVTLGSRWEFGFTQAQRDGVEQETGAMMTHCERLYGPEARSYETCWAAASNDAFLGVNPFIPEAYLIPATQPFSSPLAFVTLIQMPIGEVQGEPILSTYYPAFLEAPFNAAVFWAMVNTVFWIFWLNLLVGMFNTLPWGILDGGHIFRDTVAGIVQAVRPQGDPEKRDRIALGAGRIASYAIFAIILIQIFGPRFAPLFG